MSNRLGFELAIRCHMVSEIEGGNRGDTIPMFLVWRLPGPAPACAGTTRYNCCLDRLPHRHAARPDPGQRRPPASLNLVANSTSGGLRPGALPETAYQSDAPRQSVICDSPLIIRRVPPRLIHSRAPTCDIQYVLLPIFSLNLLAIRLRRTPISERSGDPRTPGRALAPRHLSQRAPWAFYKWRPSPGAGAPALRAERMPKCGSRPRSLQDDDSALRNELVFGRNGVSR